MTSLPDPAPADEAGLRAAWEQHGPRYLEAYATGEVAFLPYLLPEAALGFDAPRTMEILRSRLGDAVAVALAPESTDPDDPLEPPPLPIRSPVADRPDGTWLQRANLVGVNVRTVGSHWNLVKYALTLPAACDAIHLLPIWEPGVVRSLYGQAGWAINDEFFSPELAAAVPHLTTVERQLRAVVNLLHALGRAVGMDVIPHTDRFSEMALAQPQHFEWLRRRGREIVDHREHLHEEAQEAILGWLAATGPAGPGPYPVTREGFFAPAFGEEQRLRVLFGLPRDFLGRTARRISLVRHLHDEGLETVPATMGVPYRGLMVDPSDDAVTMDRYGMEWRDYLITKPGPMARVFNPLARYKLYGRLSDNADWEIDFSRPREEVWDYVCAHYAEVQRRFGFDFMRGDMSHVQMRPGGVPAAPDRHYDLLGTVKEHIRTRNGVPWFGYFAESFLPPPDVFAYGEEMDHLEASHAEATLGDLQSTAVGSPEFLDRLARYRDLLATRSCAPSFTVMTADKDDPRFDALYLEGNEVRLFLALFLADMPSYTALGFETRDPHPEPRPNEWYTKLYVFEEEGTSNRYPSKARFGPYRWGRNAALFTRLTRLRLFADAVLPEIRERPLRWLLPLEPASGRRVLAWTQSGEPELLFLANLDPAAPGPPLDLPAPAGWPRQAILEHGFSTLTLEEQETEPLRAQGARYRLPRLGPGEGRAYRVALRKEAGP
ncbi:MAG: hypothetical protein JW785_07670 [Acidimicrobiia bacterium]|nr:hypothetical protein [Acidimicrobiia bacterium]